MFVYCVCVCLVEHTLKTTQYYAKLRYTRAILITIAFDPFLAATTAVAYHPLNLPSQPYAFPSSTNCTDLQFVHVTFAFVDKSQTKIQTTKHILTHTQAKN